MSKSSLRLRGKVAIITGGGTGIGRASSLLFAREGASVAVAGRRLAPLQEVVHDIESAGGRALAIVADIGIEEDTQRIVAETAERFGALHVLFNNAAVVDLSRPVLEMTLQEWDHCLDVTLRSAFLLSKWAAPVMKSSGGGSIINCGSVGGIAAWAGGAAYCAAKGGLLQLTKVLAIEFGPLNIRVNTLSPGAVMTPNLELAIQRKNHREKLLSKSVFRRIGEPNEIASAALFLASDEASFITGSNLVADGGYLTL